VFENIEDSRDGDRLSSLPIFFSFLVLLIFIIAAQDSTKYYRWWNEWGMRLSLSQNQN